MHRACRLLCRLFFFNDTATTEIYTLSLHDALPISRSVSVRSRRTPGSANRASGSQNARCTSALATKAGRDVSANTNGRTTTGGSVGVLGLRSSSLPRRSDEERATPVFSRGARVEDACRYATLWYERPTSRATV